MYMLRCICCVVYFAVCWISASRFIKKNKKIHTKKTTVCKNYKRFRCIRPVYARCKRPGVRVLMKLLGSGSSCSSCSISAITSSSHPCLSLFLIPHHHLLFFQAVALTTAESNRQGLTHPPHYPRYPTVRLPHR